MAGEANTAAVDINSIPTDLIERVDVLTGAVSAIYGADGVTGVVNFILKRDFEGLTGRVQFGISKYGDAGNRFGSLTAGKNFGDGRGNVTLAYEYNSDDAVANDDRPFLTFDQRKFSIPNDAYDRSEQQRSAEYPGRRPPVRQRVADRRGLHRPTTQSELRRTGPSV